MRQYPETVAEVLDDNTRFKLAALCAIRIFAKSGPWSGTTDDRKEKFRKLNHDLAVAYGIREPDLLFGVLDGSSSCRSRYMSSSHEIVLTGKLSVVTYLHEFAHARGMGERGACRWSLNLFRRVWPRQYGRLTHHGHMLVRLPDVGRNTPREGLGGIENPAILRTAMLPRPR